MNAYAKTGAFLIAGALLCDSALAERKYSDWGPPVNLGCEAINTVANDFGPTVSKDGLSLYFGSNRVVEGASGDVDIYVAQRASPDDAWGFPRNLGTVVNSTGADGNPNLSRDSHWMFFNSTRTGFGDVDLWVSYRAHVHDDFAWEKPVNLGAGVNTEGFNAGASYFENETGTALLFYGSGPAQATSDIWVAELQPDGTFGNARRIAELSSPQQDQRPSVRFDGLEIFFFSSREGSMPNAAGVPTTDLWVSSRKSVDQSWGAPVNLGATVNSAFNDINPHISADGLTLYFASGRPGCGGNDLYVTTRTRLKGHD